MNKIIVSLDMSKERAFSVIKTLEPVESFLAGYKVGSLLVYENGLGVISEIKNRTDVRIIYDGQKLATDIPNITELQVMLIAFSGADEIIACPMGAGNETLKSFAKACFRYNAVPVCVVEMTHPGASRYLGKFISSMILKDALAFGIKNFVYPATKPEILRFHKNIDAFGGKDITIKSTGFKVQGGLLSQLKELGVTEFIVGRAVYEAEDPVRAVKELFNEIN